MTPEQKKQQVEDLRGTFSGAKVVVLSDFSGLTVAKADELRKHLRENQVTFRVVKNTLARRAVEGTDFEVLKGEFEGPVVMALSSVDIITPAKLLDKFMRENDKGLEFKSGALDGKLLTAAEVTQLARLPNLDESRSMLLNLFLAPATSLVRLLNEVPTSLARVLSARNDALDKQG